MTTKPGTSSLVSNATFERLRQVIKDVEEKETHLKTLRETIDDEDGLVVRYQLAEDLVIDIEEKEVKCRQYKKKIEMVQKLILAKRRIMYEVNDKLDKKHAEKLKLIEKTEGYVKQVEENAIAKQKNIKVTNIMNRLVAYRKTHLLQEVMDLFKIDIDGGPASMQPNRNRSDCKCVLVDTIRGLHLPHVASIQLSPHNERETTAAIGILIHMMEVLGRILGYAFRYPIVPYSSSSRIYCPVEDKWAVLSGWKKRADRERFFEGLGWLGKNIAQLRNDCGIPTPLADKTLSVLADWIRSVVEGKYVSIYERPKNNSSSPASLLINFESIEEALPTDPVT
uniref:APG6 domain-containing protein n=1 Tax=Caenorhabditis tropicalis TaxID=1561998 RepID=A0A1I7T797_9PELO